MKKVFDKPLKIKPTPMVGMKRVGPRCYGLHHFTKMK